MARVITAAVAALALLGSACSDDSADVRAVTAGQSPVTETAPPGVTFSILLVSNDGYDSPGLDAVAEYMRTLDGVELTVVATLEDIGSTGDQTSGGDLSVTQVATASGYPAVAIGGYAADVVNWALTEGGVQPDVVISGVNNGANYGVDRIAGSGTIGAAATAARLGFSAIAVGQGAGAEGQEPYYASAVEVLDNFLADNFDAYQAGNGPELVSINVPTCPHNELFDTVVALPATSFDVDPQPATPCDGPLSGEPTDDVEAFSAGHGVVTYLDPFTLEGLPG